jgi:hypothetical protein
MRANKPAVLVALTVVLIGVPILTDRWLAAKYARHDELVRLAECYPFPCAADFNGNGSLDRLALIQNTPTDRSDWRLTVLDGDLELFAIPYDGTDGTFRTHAAIYKPTQVDVPHLLIYDGASRQRLRSAFAWNGEKMQQVEASTREQEILSAMSARDDTGSWSQWALWRLASEVLLPIYCLVAGGALILFSIFWRRKNKEAVL